MPKIFMARCNWTSVLIETNILWKFWRFSVKNALFCFGYFRKTRSKTLNKTLWNETVLQILDSIFHCLERNSSFESIIWSKLDHFWQQNRFISKIYSTWAYFHRKKSYHAFDSLWIWRLTYFGASTN